MVLRDDGQNVCGNPAPVVDKSTGIIHLLTTWNLGEDREKEIIEGKSKDTRRIFVMRSADDLAGMAIKVMALRAVPKMLRPAAHQGTRSPPLK